MHTNLPGLLFGPTADRDLTSRRPTGLSVRSDSALISFWWVGFRSNRVRENSEDSAGPEQHPLAKGQPLPNTLSDAGLISSLLPQPLHHRDALGGPAGQNRNADAQHREQGQHHPHRP